MKFVGKKCPFCENFIEENEDIVICSRCKTPHHRDCWKANHGCMTYSCYGEMLTPQDFEEPEFYKREVNNLSEEDLEVSKADGSQFVDFYGGNSVTGAVFKGVNPSSQNNSTNNGDNSNQRLSELFPKKTEEEIREELRAKLKEEIKSELKDEIKIKPATALICERCGASLPISETRGKVVCQSCLTEYILNNDNGKKILKEIHFDNPFLDRLVDSELCDLKDYIDFGKDNSTAYKKLVSMQKNNSQKSGYWILRLRAYTDDFKKVNSDYKFFDEVFKCLKEHIKLYPFEEDEMIFVDDYFERNNHALNARLNEIKTECENFEKRLKKCKSEEKELNVNLNNLLVFKDKPKEIKKKIKKDNPKVYLWHGLFIAGTIVFGITIIPLVISIFLIPLAILFFMMQITCGVGISVCYSMKKRLEDDFRNWVDSQTKKVEYQLSENKKSIFVLKEYYVKDFYEYKKITEIVSFNMRDFA